MISPRNNVVKRESLIALTFFLIGISLFIQLFIGSPDGKSYSFLIYHFNDRAGFPYIAPMWSFINGINQAIFFDQRWLVLLFYSGISISVVMYVIYKKSINFWTTFALYVGMYFLLEGVTQLRAGAANAIFLLALYHLCDGKKVKYLTKIFFAFLFHYSSVVALPCLFFNKNRFNKLLYLILLLIAPMFWLARAHLYPFFCEVLERVIVYLPEVIRGKILNYLFLESSGVITAVNSFTFFDLSAIFNLLILIFLVVNYKRLSMVSKNNIILLKVSVYGIVFYYIFSVFPVMASRVAIFLMLPTAMLYGSVSEIFVEKQFIRIAIIACSIIYGVLFWARLYL